MPLILLVFLDFSYLLFHSEAFDPRMPLRSQSPSERRILDIDIDIVNLELGFLRCLVLLAAKDKYKVGHLCLFTNFP